MFNFLTHSHSHAVSYRAAFIAELYADQVNLLSIINTVFYYKSQFLS